MTDIELIREALTKASYTCSPAGEARIRDAMPALARVERVVEAAVKIREADWHGEPAEAIADEVTAEMVAAVDALNPEEEKDHA